MKSESGFSLAIAMSGLPEPVAVAAEYDQNGENEY